MKLFNNYMITYFKKIIYSVIFLVPTAVFGAQAYFVTSQSVVGVEKGVLVDVYVDTDAVAVNAIEGSVLFPAGALTVVDIRNGNSALNFWVEQPKESSKGTVSFSGITPGGVAGKLYLFSIFYKTKQEGGATLRFESLRVLKHNGTGEEIELQTPSYALRITHDQDTDPNTVSGIFDTVAPEDFRPEISSNEDIYDGRYTVVFATQDKGSGIDHFEIKEGFWGDFTYAESPYLLTDQSLHKKIYIKAIDKNQNNRVVVLNPQNPILWYRDYTILAILLIVCVSVYYLRKTWRRFLKMYFY
jgi:hypothetical protein